MKASGLALVCLAVLASGLAAPASSATPVEREFLYGASRFTLVPRDQFTEIQMRGAAREYEPGRPDLPWVSETVDLPAGLRVTGVEVVALETAELAPDVRLPSTERLEPGLGPIARTAPDPAYFARAGFQPVEPVRLGPQGALRGRNLVQLQVCPVRWDAASGRLERVTRIRVRLTLAEGAPAVVPRERIVREWEDGLPSGIPTRELGAALQSSDAGGRTPQPFRPTQIPSVLGSPVAYVIITGDALVPQFQRLADWKTQSGVPAVVRTLSFIRQQYPAAADDAERIRLFIRDAYSRWGTKWVLLGGDTDVLPTRMASTLFYGGENIACDMYFSCLDGNWNADGDSAYGEAYQTPADTGDAVDLMPEVYVGRAPVTTLAQATLFVDKSLQYVCQPVTDYQRSLLFFAEVLFPQEWQPGMTTSLDGAELVEEVLPTLQVNPSLHIARLYENYTDPRWQPGALIETRQAVLDSLNHGYNVAVHVGHGYRNVMSVGDGSLTNPDAQALTNGSRLFNLYAINCTSNAIDFPCIGEAFVLAPHGGAVTNIGSSRLDFPTAGRSYQDEYFRLVYDDSVNAVGEALARSKVPFVVFSTYDGVHRWTQMTLLLLGDPELRIYTGQPRLLAVTYPGSVTVSDTVLDVHVTTGGSPLAGARVTAYKADDEYRTTLTDALGDARLAFHPDTIGSFTLTVTGYDCKPFQAVIPITASSLAALAGGTPVVDDDNLGGTAGNSDGTLDAGETIDLMITARNNGGTAAPNVVGTLSTADPLVTLVSPTVNYGTIPAGGSSSPAAGYRISLPFTAPDQHEISFQLLLADGNGVTDPVDLQLTVHAPELWSFSHTLTDLPGNQNGRPDPGETLTYRLKLRNQGTGLAENVTAVLSSLDTLTTVTDGTASFGNLTPGQEAEGDAFVLVCDSTNAALQLVISDKYGPLTSQRVDLVYPNAPGGLTGLGAATSIRLTWVKSGAPDLLGYNVYRSATLAGTYSKVNVVPTDRTAYYQDGSLAPLTPYYYKVTAVDSAGNESSQSAAASASTNPPFHGLFPMPMARTTPSSVAVDHLYDARTMDIVAGSDVLYLWHADGSAPVDADGSGATPGDFTIRGKYYAAGPSIADLDRGGKEIIAPCWDSLLVFAFDMQGNVKPGWPVATYDPIWSSAAVGDLNNDGQQEVVFGSNGNNIYAFRANGTEWMDGDANPSTKGVFKVLGQPCNYGTPALADVDGNGVLDIIYGSFDGYLYAWRPDGTNLPGFPVNLGASITCSPAVGYLDGPSDTQLEIVVTTAGDQVFVVEANGTIRPGWPSFFRASGVSRSPSPALADMNNDGYLEIVLAATNGTIQVRNRDGPSSPPFGTRRYSALTSSSSESSPVVADINGDGVPDILMGDENGQLNALSGATGAVLPGFPIQLDAEVRGTPAVADIDGDGKTEIVLACWDRNLYVWDYDFPFSPGHTPPWPQFHHDAARTGFSGNQPFVDVEETVEASRIPATLEFAPPSPNPARGTARFWFGVPTARAGAPFEVAVYDLSGRRVQVVERGTARAGRHSAEWNLRSERGGPVEAGIYFLRFSLGSESRSQKLVVLK